MYAIYAPGEAFYYIKRKNSTITFNANGTYSSNQWGNGSYFVSNSKLILNKTDELQLTSLLSYYLSADGKVLVLADNSDSGSGIWLVKK